MSQTAAATAVANRQSSEVVYIDDSDNKVAAHHNLNTSHNNMIMLVWADDITQTTSRQLDETSTQTPKQNISAIY